MPWIEVTPEEREKPSILEPLGTNPIAARVSRLARQYESARPAEVLHQQIQPGGMLSPEAAGILIGGLRGARFGWPGAIAGATLGAIPGRALEYLGWPEERPSSVTEGAEDLLKAGWEGLLTETFGRAIGKPIEKGFGYFFPQRLTPEVLKSPVGRSGITTGEMLETAERRGISMPAPEQLGPEAAGIAETEKLMGSMPVGAAGKIRRSREKFGRRVSEELETPESFLRPSKGGGFPTEEITLYGAGQRYAAAEKVASKRERVFANQLYKNAQSQIPQKKGFRASNTETELADILKGKIEAGYDPRNIGAVELTAGLEAGDKVSQFIKNNHLLEMRLGQRVEINRTYEGYRNLQKELKSYLRDRNVSDQEKNLFAKLLTSVNKDVDAIGLQYPKAIKALKAANLFYRIEVARYFAKKAVPRQIAEGTYESTVRDIFDPDNIASLATVRGMLRKDPETWDFLRKAWWDDLLRTSTDRPTGQLDFGSFSSTYSKFTPEFKTIVFGSKEARREADQFMSILNRINEVGLQETKPFVRSEQLLSLGSVAIRGALAAAGALGGYTGIISPMAAAGTIGAAALPSIIASFFTTPGGIKLLTRGLQTWLKENPPLLTAMKTGVRLPVYSGVTQYMEGPPGIPSPVSQEETLPTPTEPLPVTGGLEELPSLPAPVTTQPQTANEAVDYLLRGK